MPSDDRIVFGEPHISQSGMTFGFEWKRDDKPLLRVQIEDVRSDGGEIKGDFTVWWLWEQQLGVLPVQPFTTVKMNTNHHGGWRGISNNLSKRIDGVDFEGALVYAVNHSIERFRQGEPTVELFNGARSTEPPFILDPWISNSGITTLYGEGGLSKSLITLAMGISVSTGVPIFGQEPLRTGPVIIFDYEDDHQTHVDRLLAICRSLGVPPEHAKVYHHALASKVATSHREMQRRVQETGAVLGILDSVGMARGGSAVAAEDTIKLYRYLRAIGIPFLCIDHISKEAKEKKSASDRDAYGSVYSMNSVRLGWSLQRQETNRDTIDIFAANTKHNHVPKQKPQTMSIRYRNDAQGVPEFIDIEVGNDFGFVMETLGPREKIALLLHGVYPEELTNAQISDQLGMPSSSVRRHMSADQNSPTPMFTMRKQGNMTFWSAQGIGEHSVSTTDEE